MAIHGSFLEEWLPSNHLAALSDSIDWLTDVGYDDIRNAINPDWTFADCYMAAHLPSRYASALTPLFAKQFHVCILTVGWKLAQQCPMMLSCVAEELALRAILAEAELRFEERGEVADFTRVEEELFEDLDVEFLFSEAWGNVAPSVMEEFVSGEMLDLPNWFDQFGAGERTIPHPYIQTEVALNHIMAKYFQYYRRGANR